LLKQWFAIAHRSIQEHDQFSVALAGGKTPLEFYCQLSGAQDFALWDKTHIFFTDERFVAPEDEDSNIGMIQNALLNYVPLHPDQIHAIHTHTGDVRTAAECYEEDLTEFFRLGIGERPRFDLILLGVGEDGHVASLFPGEKQIEEEVRLTVAVTSDRLKQPRISLSLPVINQARTCLVVVQGRNKADIMKRILIDKKDLPARKVMPPNGELYFLLDKEAASQLSYLSEYTHQDQAVAVKY
jgi:6-phosphogluconolactonase